MAFPPKQDHRIPLAEAAARTKQFREGGAKGSEIGLMLPRDVFEQLLKNGRVRGVRFYYARTGDAKLQLIAVGVDADGNDILEDGDIFDRGFPCPPVCGGGNALNS